MRNLPSLMVLFGWLWLSNASGVRAADFVLLSEVAPGIVQSMRYATPINFTGAAVPGYETGTCILTRPTALALAKVQNLLEAQGLGLVVFDCYRPERAVAAFVDWSRKAGIDADPAKRFHAPNVPARQLFAEGYIAKQSGHSRGHTVDLGIIALGAELTPPQAFPSEGDCTTVSRPDLADMGSSFDCLDRKSWNGAAGLTAEQRRNRNTLRAAMTAGGFKPYNKEWWHFAYPPGDPGKAFDFLVDPVALSAVH